MHYLQAKNIHKSYGINPLFKGIDFSIMQGQKIALVARNGAGKSTLLRILSKQEEPDAGEMFFNGDVKVAILKQAYSWKKTDIVIDVIFDEKHPHGKLLKKYELLCRDENASTEAFSDIIEKIEEAGARDYEVQIKTVISKMKLDDLLGREMGRLSGGEEKRVMIARLLLDEADFLFLDEPTNHLDLDMIEWLERYLKNTKQTFLLVTHDRYFLERVCSHIFELDDGKLYQYVGNYSKFLIKKAEREEHAAKTLHNMKQVLKKEVEWMKKAPRARASKSVKREKDFYELYDSYHEKKREQYQLGKKVELSIAGQRMGDKVLKVNNISKSFDDLKIVKWFSYDFRKQERVGIIGKNGVGKSTFIRLLTGEETLDSGNVKRGSTITVGHYRQEQVRFDESKRVLDVVKDVSEYIQIAPGKRITAALLLERFLFSPEQQRMKAEKLSGGEKRRLGLLCTLIANPNFLILDEPTNDFDLMTLAVLEEFLLSYPGCIVIISHDRFFMDKLVDHLFVFEWDGVISDFRGSYSERHEQKKSPVGTKKEAKNIEVITKNSSTKKGLSNKERKQILTLEEEIELLEERKEEINTLFQSWKLESIEFSDLSKELAKVLKTLEEKEGKWLELAE